MSDSVVMGQMTAQRYRKKPVEIEAIQLRWDTWNGVCEFVNVGDLDQGQPQGVWVDPADGKAYKCPNPPGHLSLDDAEIGLLIPTLEGEMLARQNDWIIRDVKGEFYPCKPDIFAATYEAVLLERGEQR